MTLTKALQMIDSDWKRNVEGRTIRPLLYALTGATTRRELGDRIDGLDGALRMVEAKERYMRPAQIAADFVAHVAP